MIIDNIGKMFQSRCLRLRKAFKDPLTPTHLSSFSSALNVFTTYNKSLQRSDPLSYKVYPVTLMHILTLQALKNGVSLESLNHSTCYLPLEKDFLWFFH